MTDTLSPDRREDIASRRANSKAYFSKYFKSNDATDLASAIDNAEFVVKRAPTASTEHLEMTWMLGHGLNKRFEKHQRQETDLERSICLFNTWLRDAPEKHFERPFVLCNLATAFRLRFEISKDRKHLEEALQQARKALDLSALDPNLHLAYLRTVEEQLRHLWLNFEEMDVLEKLIQIQRDVLQESTSRDDKDKWYYMNDLGKSLLASFWRTKNLEHLREVLPLARAACDGIPEGYDVRVVFTYLAIVLEESIDTDLLPLSELDECFEFLRKAMSKNPIEANRRTRVLCKLIIRHIEAYEEGLGDNHLHSAVAFQKEVTDLSPDDDQNSLLRPRALAICLASLSERTGQQSYLDEAIKISRNALDFQSSPDEEKAAMAQSLAGNLVRRYKASSSAVADLEEAVSRARDAVRWTAITNSWRAARMGTLGMALAALFDRTRQHEYIDEAINCTKETIRCSVYKDNEGIVFCNFSMELRKRYNALHSEDDRIEALKFAKKAVESTSKEHTYYPYVISNLADQISWEFMLTRDSPNPAFEKLQEAIELDRLALASTPETHADWSDYAYSLGINYMRFAEYTKNKEVAQVQRDKSIEAFKKALKASSGPLSKRVWGGRRAMVALMVQERWAEANEPSIHVARRDMQHTLKWLSVLSRYSAAASLSSGEAPEEAIATLQMGRGLISGALIGSRADLSILNAVDPKISSEYQDVVDQLSKQRISKPEIDPVLYRQNLMDRLSSVEEHIRTLPGLSRFQLPASGEELKGLASEGPLVFFSVTRFRSDAFIVTTDKIGAIPLPLLQESDLDKHSEAIVGDDRITVCKATQRRKSNVRLAKILIWLWNVAVKPVLDHLGFPSRPGIAAAELPRVWWVASGLMGLMPLHAAGSQWEESGENTASRVVSSYVHTIKALAYSREQTKRRSEPTSRSILAVESPGVPEAGWVELNTKQEMVAIRDASLAAGVPSAILSRPTASAVLESLRGNTIAHFACHGSPDYLDPSKMSLVLCKDARTPDLLAVSQLFDEKHEHAELAYLSACCTAQQYNL
ncbi:hypothetical protein IWZ01DRAFT_529644, partial [Phyllosticta capitalensis]